MELTHQSFVEQRPQVRATALAWHWEPEIGTGERIAAILALQPHESSVTLLSPAAHVLLPRLRLASILGRKRADSAYGILRTAAEFMTLRLIAGAGLEECPPPFDGFHRSVKRVVLGFSSDQLVDAAVRSASAFGHTDEIADELIVELNHSTQATKAFLARVQTVMAPANDEKRNRFNKRVDLGGANMMIDYAYLSHLVQFATAPTTERQQQNMLREAKAKLFEAQGVAKTTLQGAGRQTLLVNTSAFLDASGSARDVAQSTLQQFKQLAALVDARMLEAQTHEAAVCALVDLEYS